MPDYPSEAPTSELSVAFPSRIPAPEALVYEHVRAAAQNNLPIGRPAVSFYEDNARAVSEGKTIYVGRGWPAYPGPVPQIGVGSGQESQDQAQKIIQGGYVGEARHEVNGELRGLADYYAFPLYIPVVVILIHENRDERDRLHDELRLVMAPLTTDLPLMDGQIKAVAVDGQKDEIASEGAPPDTAPFLIYSSTFTVHVYCEMLKPRNITGPGGIVQQIDVAATTPVTAVREFAYEARAD